MTRSSSFPAEQASRPCQQDNDHDEKDDRFRRGWIDDLGYTLNQTQCQAADDGPHDGAQTADHHYREYCNDEVGAHQWTDRINRCGQYAGQGCQANPEAERQGDHQRHVYAEGLHQLRILDTGAQQCPPAGAFDDEPRQQTQDDGKDDGKQPVVGEEHEAKIDNTVQTVRLTVVRCARDVEIIGKDSLQDQCNAKGQQQAVNVVELVQPAQHCAFQQDAETAHQQGGDHQCRPEAEMKIVKTEPWADMGVADQCHESAQHVERAVGEIDDIEQPEDDGQPQAQHGVEHTHAQAQHHLRQDQIKGKMHCTVYACRSISWNLGVVTRSDSG